MWKHLIKAFSVVRALDQGYQIYNHYQDYQHNHHDNQDEGIINNTTQHNICNFTYNFLTHFNNLSAQDHNDVGTENVNIVGEINHYS